MRMRMIPVVAVALMAACAGAEPTGERTLFLDVHELGAGNVTRAAVAEAHQKDPS